MIENEVNAISMASWSGKLVKRPVSLYETRNLQERFAVLIWETKVKVFLEE